MLAVYKKVILGKKKKATTIRFDLFLKNLFGGKGVEMITKPALY